MSGLENAAPLQPSSTVCLWCILFKDIEVTLLSCKEDPALFGPFSSLHGTQTEARSSKRTWRAIIAREPGVIDEGDINSALLPIKFTSGKRVKKK